MHNPIWSLGKALLFWRNQVFCLRNWKLWRAPSTTEFNFFCWNFAHFFFLPMCAYSGFFLFCLDLELFAKNRKDLVSTHSLFTFLIITQDLNEIKKILYTLLQSSLSRKRVQNVTQKLYGSWNSPKFSIFQANNLVSRKQ